jgi:hypothetical protein
MDWKEFFRFNWMKLLIFLLLLLLLPFLSYKDEGTAVCTQSIPSSCTNFPPTFKINFMPSYILDNIGISLGATTGSDYRNQTILVNQIILVSKIIISLLLSCLIAYFWKGKKSF